MTELIERYQDYRARTPPKNNQHTQIPAIVQMQQTWDRNDTLRSEWNFETVKSAASVMGSFRSLTNAKENFLPIGVELDEGYTDEEEGLASIEESEDGFDTTGPIKGNSDPSIANGLGVNPYAQHSTVVIRGVTNQNYPESSMVGQVESDSTLQPPSPPLGEPPAYSGHSDSVRSMRPAVGSGRRSSYAARHNLQGTVMREADFGNGIDTIRPVKRVDAAGSLRLSAEYVGTLRNREGGSMSPLPQEIFMRHRRENSESAKAGKAMVKDIVMPVIQNVGEEIGRAHV